MKLHYKGKYNLDPESLPRGEHKPNAVKFKEFDSPKKMGIFCNIAAFALIIILFIPVFLYKRPFNSIGLYCGCIAPMLSMFPHEFLHAICFKKDVYLYTDFSHGLLFVTGPEDFSKSRFIFMSLLPNIVFGIVPYIISFLMPSIGFFAMMGAFAVSMGTGDYYNVFNALTQMPKGSRVYNYGFNSYWYIPTE